MESINIIMNNLLKLGKKVFTVGVASTTIFWSLGVAALVPAVASAATVNTVACSTIVAGDFIKGTGAAVWAVNGDKSMSYFPDGDTFKSWTVDGSYNSIKTVDATCMGTFPQASIVAARPGAYLLKDDATNKLYTVTAAGKLASISTDVASALYGTNYDLAPAKGGRTVKVATPDMMNYNKNLSTTSVTEAAAMEGSLVSNGGKYYLVGANKGLREVTATGLTANKFQKKLAYALTSTSGYAMGTAVDAAEANLFDATFGFKSNGTTLPVVTATGALTVSLAANTAAAGNVPAGAQQIPVLTLNFTAGQADAVVTGLNVYRTGLSSDADLGTIYLMDGSQVMATNLGIATGKVMFSMGTGLFTVKAGTTKTITVAADLNTDAKDYAFGLNAAADVTATGMTVGGTFPVQGNHLYTITPSNPSLATLTINNTVTGGTTNAGSTNVLVGQMTVQSANSNVQVKSIKLTETGTINAATDLANIKLMNGATQVGNTAPALNSDGTLTFDLSANPLVITSGQTVTLSVYADVISGVGRNFTFTIQRAYDVVSTDTTYNVGAKVFSNSSATTFTVVNMTQVSVSQGSLTLTRDASSPSNYVAKGTTNQVWGAFAVKANGEAVRVTGATFGISWNTALAENTVFNNLKLIDDQGVQLGSTYTSGSTSATASQNSALSNLNYVVPANTTRILYIKADVISNTSAVTLNSTLTSLTAQGYTSLASISAGPGYGNALSLAGTPFGLSLNNQVGAVTTVAGGTNLKVGSFILSAGPAEGANLNTLTVSTIAGLNAKFVNLHVKVGGADFGLVQNNLAAAATPYTFTATTPVAIAANNSVVVDVYADSLTGVSLSATSTVSVTAANASGVTTYVPLTMSPTSLAGQTVALSSAGHVATSTSPAPAMAQQVAMGLTAVKVASLKLLEDSNSEDMKILNVTLKDSGANTTVYNDLVNFRLMNGTNVVGTAVGSFSDSSAGITFTLANPDMVAGKGLVPQNNSMTLDVLADVNTRANGATSGDVHSYYISNVGVQGAQSSSSTSVLGQPSSAAVNLTVYRTTLLGDVQRTSGGSVDSSYVDNSIADGKVVAKFVFIAGPNDDATLNTTTISALGAEVAANSSTAVTYTFWDGNTQVGSQAITSSTPTAAALSYNGNVFVVGKGTSKVLTVKANLNTASYGYNTNLKGYSVSLTGFTFYDGSNNVSADANKNTFPISGPSMSF